MDKSSGGAEVVPEYPSVNSDLFDVLDKPGKLESEASFHLLSNTKTKAKIETEQEFRSFFDGNVNALRKRVTVAQELNRCCAALKTGIRKCPVATLNFIPLISTMRNYQKAFLVKDFNAGLAEGIMSIPQSLSYAMLANLPPVYGLYNASVFPLVYAFFGTCREISTGVSAIESLITAEGVGEVIGWIGNPDDGTDPAKFQAKLRVTTSLCIIVGIFQFVMRFFKLGALSSLLADPVLSGFNSACAFLIGTSQLKHLFGFKLMESNYTPVIWYDALANIKNWNFTALIMGIIGIGFLVFMKLVNERHFQKFPLPAPLLLVILGIIITRFGKLYAAPFNVKILRTVPDGPPTFGLPSFEDASFGQLIKPGLTLALMTYIIAISMSKNMGNLGDYQVDADQELVAMGSCNIVGAFFHCFPNACSLARTAIVKSNDARSPLHNFVYAGLVLLTLAVLTPLLYYLPKCLLASIILQGVAKMIAFHDAKIYWMSHKADFLLWCVSFFITTVFGAIYGVAASIIVSLIWLLKKVAHPTTAILGQVPGTEVYINAKKFKIAQTFQGLHIFRFDAPLHFANKDYFEANIKKLAMKPGTHTIIIDCSSMPDLDSSAVRMLLSLVKKLDTMGVVIMFANWKRQQRDFLDSSGLFDVITPSHVFFNLHDAVEFVLKNEKLLAGDVEDPSAEERKDHADIDDLFGEAKENHDTLFQEQDDLKVIQTAHV